MANSQIKNVRAEKGDYESWSKCVDSLSKRLIYFSILEILVKIGLLLNIFEARTFRRSLMRPYVQPQHSRKWLYHWRNPQILDAYVNRRTS